MSVRRYWLAWSVLCLVAIASLGCEPDAAAVPADQEAATQKSGADDAKAARPANRLARETSPYLLLHAHNPVNWYPWGPEALELARRENKLIFLSIGYSSCHWCHVMERESFMDVEIAAYLNEHFVCIKVDREERPELDEIYMTSLQFYFRLAGSQQGGGWPLTMLLTPDAKPFFGATYLPPRNRDGRTGLLTILKQIEDVWRDNPEKILANGQQLAEIVKSALRERALAGGKLPSVALADEVAAAMADEHDPQYGGFGYVENDPSRPKFPDSSNLMFLLDRARRQPADEGQENQAQQILEQTLGAMARGGIYDHLGGGFHRYSTDRYWRIPHFEKMLYDNGQLASIYSEAYALTERDDFRRVVEELLAMIERDFTSPEGAFYAALDAESDGREGGYHAWKKADVEPALTPEEYAVFSAVYGLSGEPNFEEHEYVLVLAESPAEAAQRLGLAEAEVLARLESARQKLLALRDTRPRPLTDTKILADWNGLMIAGYADAGRILKEDRFIAAAERAAEFILSRMRDEKGRLAHVFAAGATKPGAYLDDYTHTVAGLLALHRATGEAKWLDAADALTKTQIELFWDQEAGGFYFTAGDHEELIARSKQGVDSATPSGNAVAALNLIALAAALEKPEYLEYAKKTIAAFGGLSERAPLAVPTMARATVALEEATRSGPLERSGE